MSSRPTNALGKFLAASGGTLTLLLNVFFLSGVRLQPSNIGITYILMFILGPSFVVAVCFVSKVGNKAQGGIMIGGALVVLAGLAALIYPFSWNLSDWLSSFIPTISCLAIIIIGGFLTLFQRPGT